MCGRYTLVRGDKIVQLVSNVTKAANLRFVATYNAAPGQLLPVIVSGTREVQLAKWGMVPEWSRENKGLTLARAETVAEKPAFRQAFAQRRCLVPADGFYEWRQERKGKSTPFYARMRDGELFAMAGLWTPWRGEDGEIVHTFAILTTTPNEIMTAVHDRMPVILPRERYAEWLDTSRVSAEECQEWLKPFVAEEMEAHAVATTVNAVRNNGPELIEPAPESDGEAQMSLFG